MNTTPNEETKPDDSPPAVPSDAEMAEVFLKIVTILSAFPPDQQQRILRASRIMLGLR